MAQGGGWFDSQQSIDILKNIAANVEPIQKMLTGSAYVLGLVFAFKALYSLKVYGEARTMMASNASVKEPLMYLFVAAVFLMSPQALTVFLTSTFGTGNIMEYGPANGESPLFGSATEIGKPLVMIIQTIGYIAFIRGWVLVARASAQGQQPGSTGKGLMHVFGGILAINIVSTLQIVNNTIYGV
jgi:intracellular multiplication protein IcmC